jgi:hypothetical protein
MCSHRNLVELHEEERKFYFTFKKKVLNFTAHIFSQNKVKTLKVLAPKVG